MGNTDLQVQTQVRISFFAKDVLTIIPRDSTDVEKSSSINPVRDCSDERRDELAGHDVEVGDGAGDQLAVDVDLEVVHAARHEEVVRLSCETFFVSLAVLLLNHYLQCLI